MLNSRLVVVILLYVCNACRRERGSAERAGMTTVCCEETPEFS